MTEVPRGKGRYHLIRLSVANPGTVPILITGTYLAALRGGLECVIPGESLAETTDRGAGSEAEAIIPAQAITELTYAVEYWPHAALPGGPENPGIGSEVVVGLMSASGSWARLTKIRLVCQWIAKEHRGALVRPWEPISLGAIPPWAARWPTRWLLGPIFALASVRSARLAEKRWAQMESESAQGCGKGHVGSCPRGRRKRRRVASDGAMGRRDGADE